MLEDEVPRYRKKAKSHAPTKSDHKHTYAPCVVQYPGSHYWSTGSYCAVCGKIRVTTKDMLRWLKDPTLDETLPKFTMKGDKL